MATDLRARLVLTVIAAALTVTSSWAQPSLDVVDYCPELQRSDDNPDGIRDCRAGCMDEDDFTLDNALKVLEEVRADLTSEEQPYRFGGWDREFHQDYQLKVIKGAIWRRDVMRAHRSLAAGSADPSLQQAYEIARRDYCSYLESEAMYLD